MLQLLKPTCLEPGLRNKRGHHNEKPTHGNKKSSPCSPQLEKACAKQQRPNVAKNKFRKKKKKLVQRIILLLQLISRLKLIIITCLFYHTYSSFPSLLARTSDGLNGISRGMTQTFISEGSELLVPMSVSGRSRCTFLFSVKTGKGVPVHHLEVKHLPALSV